MSQRLEPPRATQQISNTKGRVTDLERRLAKKERDQECCGETQMFAEQQAWIEYPTGNCDEQPHPSGYDFLTTSFGFETLQNWQRVKVTVKITLETGTRRAPTDPMWMYLIHAGISASDGNREYNFEMSSFTESNVMVGPVTTTITLQTMEDFPAGQWLVWGRGDWIVGSIQPSGAINHEDVAQNPYFYNVTIDVVFGQKVDSQELWSVYGGVG